MTLGLLVMVLVVGGLTAYALRYAFFGSDSTPTEAPEEILRRRLASGEITETEYRSLLDTLQHHSASSGKS